MPIAATTSATASKVQNVRETALIRSFTMLPLAGGLARRAYPQTRGIKLGRPESENLRKSPRMSPRVAVGQLFLTK
jgi:hypothetical protein